MRILIITQKVDRNDTVLGFFHTWLLEFAKNYESIEVICLEKGDYDLPQNVTVHSLGKESGMSRTQYIIRFYKNIYSLRKQYDVVFVHMNPIYVILGAFFWRAYGNRIGLWYVHKAVNLQLRLALVLTHFVFTSSPESFRIKSTKVHYVGHGVEAVTVTDNGGRIGNRLRALYLGRISEIKRIDMIIRTVSALRNMGVDVVLSVVGDAIVENDIKYRAFLEDTARFFDVSNYVRFFPAVPHEEIGTILNRADIMINASPDGGMDKVVLESWIGGVPCFTTNKAFRRVFGEYAPLFYALDEEGLVQSVYAFATSKEIAPVQEVSSHIKTHYSLSGLAKTILNIYEAGK